MKSLTKINVLLAVFIGVLIAMNILGIKIIELFGISVSVGIFLVPVAFLITDIVADVYGKKMVRQFVYIGVGILSAFFLISSIFVFLEPHERFTMNDAYMEVFGTTLRMMLASIVAFGLSQLHDIWAFEFWKKKTQGTMLWLRNNLSTFVSQAIDTVVFMFIAFYMISPQFTVGFILELAIPYYLFKIAFAVLDTPFVYLGVRWLRG
jgi:uncharacterized integral membrane protein (TIGR00697 family)